MTLLGIKNHPWMNRGELVVVRRSLLIRGLGLVVSHDVFGWSRKFVKELKAIELGVVFHVMAFGIGGGIHACILA